jgi:tetratricopeptide (TPR) repeat protein
MDRRSVAFDHSLEVFVTDRRAALSALQDALGRVAADPQRILAAESTHTAEALRAAVSGSDPAADVDVAHALGWYHWFRYLVLPEGEDQEDLEAAAGWLIHVYPSAPDAVPEALRSQFDPTAYDEESAGADPGAMNTRAIELMTAFQRTGRRELLDQAVTLFRDLAAAVPEGHPDRAIYLNNLGGALQMLFERTGQLTALTEAVQIARDAVAATPDDHPDRAGRLNNLGGALHKLFERTGQPALLAEVAQVARDAVAATPDDHPSRAGRLNNLGIALSALFNLSGELTLLTEAVHSGREAVNATSADHPDRAAYLSNLGRTLRMLFERTEELTVLIEAIYASREAVNITPDDDPDRARYLNNLGNTLRRLFEHTEELAVLTEAVQASREAVNATPDDQPSRALYLSSLGTFLHTLFETTGQLAALTEAVQASRDALAATPEDHLDYARYLNNLGIALQSLSERVGEPAVLAEARECYRKAAADATGPTDVRIAAYRKVARLSVEAGDAQDGLQSMEAAVELIGMLAPGSLAQADREHRVGLLAGLPEEAAGAALAAGRPGRAVELLERTRGILAADALGRRGTERARLQQAGHGALADQLEDLRARLNALDRPRTAIFAAADAARTTDQVTQDDRRVAEQRRRAHAEWAGLLGQIRALPGFADFLDVPPVEVLARYTRQGPVVFVTAGLGRADALILTDSVEPIRVVPLPALTLAKAYEQSNRLVGAYGSAGARDLDPAEQHDAQHEILDVLAWLWDVIAEPVLAALGHSAAPADGASWPRVWWCPVGVLAVLPLHAAGHYGGLPEPPELPGSPESHGGPRCVPDLVVSSYTPTVRALAPTAADSSTRSEGCATVIVPVPDLPGAELPGVTTESEAIAALIPKANLLHRPTHASVLQALPTHCIAHFSCHGYADWERPAASHLLLTDHETNPLTIADITRLNLNAELAYLSACSTTATAPRLADEALHITGAFQLAGYRQVVGTLWPIDDAVAAEIATDFYLHLTDAGTTAPHPEQAAFALHQAVDRSRRRHPDAPSLWAAHIHVGTNAT